MALLELENVHSYYGHIHALKGISLTVEEGEIVTLIGANGAGKSTTLRTISGLVRAREGQIRLHGKDITHLPPHEIVSAGVGHVPEGRGIFPRLTTLENLEMGAYTVNDPAEIERRLERVFGLFPRLKERLYQKGGTLSGGEQQMLATGARADAAPAKSCCWTSLRWAWRRCWWRRSSTSSAPSTSRKAPPSCWWSRTR